MTPVKRCTCNSQFQDHRYGTQMRLHRESKKGADRCTVCDPVRSKQRLQEHASAWKPLHG